MSIDPTRKDPHIQVQGSALNVNMKVNHLEAAKKTNGLSKFVFDVSFKSKEAPQEAKNLASRKIQIQADHLEMALQILHVMGEDFKKMTTGELQHHLDQKFEGITFRREHSDKKGTLFHSAIEDSSTGSVEYKETKISKKELADIRKYAGYLKSEKAISDGISDIKSAQASLELESVDEGVGATINVRKTNATAGTTLNIEWGPADNIWSTLTDAAAAEAKVEELINDFLTSNCKQHFDFWVGLISEGLPSKDALKEAKDKTEEAFQQALKEALKKTLEKLYEGEAKQETREKQLGFLEAAFNANKPSEDRKLAIENILGSIIEEKRKAANS